VHRQLGDVVESLELRVIGMHSCTAKER
jgi:hypothetical protein